MVNLVDAAATATSNVIPFLLPNTDWEADEIVDLRITAQALAGSIDFYIHRDGPIGGSFSILYSITTP